MTMPLDGIRVIDWTIWQQGPICSAMLADMGADVIRVDRASQAAGGDPASPPAGNRAWPAAGLSGDRGSSGTGRCSGIGFSSAGAGEWINRSASYREAYSYLFPDRNVITDSPPITAGTSRPSCGLTTARPASWPMSFTFPTAPLSPPTIGR